MYIIFIIIDTLIWVSFPSEKALSHIEGECEIVHCNLNRGTCLGIFQLLSLVSSFVTFGFLRSYGIPVGKFVAFWQWYSPNVEEPWLLMWESWEKGGRVTVNVEAKCFSVSPERNKPHSCIAQGGEEERAQRCLNTYAYMQIRNPEVNDKLSGCPKWAV